MDDIGDVDEQAWWRKPEGRVATGKLLQQFVEQGKAISPLWSFPGPFDNQSFKIDWLHVADIGVTAYMLGGVLFAASKMAWLGRNKNERTLRIFIRMQAWYRDQGQKEDRMGRLDVNMFKKRPPHLRGSAACLRKLVPFFELFVNKWPEGLSDEMVLAKQGFIHLAACYASLKPFDGAKLLKNSVLFGKAKAGLHDLPPSDWALPPKLHMFMELCMQDANPTAHWNYRDEDWGGGVAHMAQSRWD